MKRLHEIDGCLAYFLQLASENLDNKKNIRIDQLSAVAQSVNNRYEDLILHPFDVKDIWVEIREYYEGWLGVVNSVPKHQIDWKLGKITVNDPCEWDTILEAVPEAVKFQTQNFPLAELVHAILTESAGQNSRKYKRKRYDEGCSTFALMKEEKKEIGALMLSLNSVANLNTSLKHILFCKMFFEDKKCRDHFKLLGSDDEKFEYVDGEYNMFLNSM